MSDYIVQPISREQLREYAYQIRVSLGLENQLYFPIVQVLEVMPEIFEGFYYEILDDKDLPDCHAHTDIINRCIRIRNSVYNGACDGKGRDRMTIAHELGHYLTLVVSSFKLNRAFKKTKVNTYQDPEWQAKAFAGELLIPAHLVKGMRAKDVEHKCGVSKDAAKFQLSRIR